MSTIRMPCLLVVFFCLQGCASTYIDPSYAHTRYRDLQRPAQPAALNVDVTYENHGDPVSQGSLAKGIHRSVERTLRTSGLIIPTPHGADGEIAVTFNETTPLTAVSMGEVVGSALTLRLLTGPVLHRTYEMSVTISEHGKTITKSGYKHLLYDSYGVHLSPPPGAVAVSPFHPGEYIIIEQMLLNALRDFQVDGVLAPNVPSP
jgi:hypothetical protein